MSLISIAIRTIEMRSMKSILASVEERSCYEFSNII